MVTIAKNQYAIAEAVHIKLGQAKVEAIARINTSIGEIRKNFITDIPAQEMIYQAKENEAKAYLADDDPLPEDYPLIHAEIGITADDAYQLSQLWLNMSQILRETAAHLENIRLGAIAAIEQAQSQQDIAEIMNTFNAASLAVSTSNQ
ncbi:hypothetical protein MR829_12630 [Paracoccus versutus]|uniref:hypothetical protein n=1 Tax=Paracoccus versutus TaxID=34007 RepID=UPI001FB607B5|nr:hypothetical protein [Paracoccus versutus]MCJ1901219.1 hypothetical protein [Paracoccus versutus]